MKQLLYRIVFCCLAAVVFAACDKDDTLHATGAGADGNSIILDLASASLPVTRATVEAAGVEVAVSHLDVLIFDENGMKEWHERVSGTANKDGTITLSAKRSDFTANEKYWVYLIANSTADVNTFKAEDFNLAALKGMTQEDERIHITGLQNITGGAPQTFLMYGIAYPKGKEEPATAATVVLNNGTEADNTELQVTLSRAAAKIVVRIRKGKYVEFGDRPKPEASQAGYYLRNMPYTTSVVPPQSMDAETAKLRTPDLYNGPYYFEWTAEEITVTSYAYAHKWDDESTLEKEVRLIVNIPLNYIFHDEEGNFTGKTEYYLNSYYQIPVSKTQELNRNTCYIVDVTLNAPGGSDPSEPVELTDISYSVYEWQEEHVNVGGEGERPVYLTLNEYEMEMHNMEDDNTTLEFASSSEVEAKITRVYYIDKFGQEKDLELNQETGKYGEKYTTSGGWETHWKNECDITITPDEDINGKIHVHSTVPENNTIRYITFDVTNKDRKTKTVTVEQYPLEYITNIQSWYSYRDDFKNSDPNPTTYEYQGDRIYGVSYSNNSYEYESSYYQSFIIGGYEANTSSGFWRSKVANSHNTNGSSNIKYYYYDSKGDRKESNAETGNARMYHVRITASSGDYTIGNPRITDGYTDPGADNAQLVSPSFMIASRLGFVNTSAGGVIWTADYALDVARKHCKEYVEVYKDKNGNKVALKDWRLPTTAELKIIMKFQGEENEDADAIDYLLNADYYWSASERVSNNKSSSGGTSIRCIRDAYDKKTGK